MEMELEKIDNLKQPLLGKSGNNIFINIENEEDISDSIKDWDDYKGLSEEEALERLLKYGRNIIEEKKVSVWWKIFGYFITPMAIMMEIALIISIS